MLHIFEMLSVSIYSSFLCNHLQTLYQLSGFRDIDKLNPDAWPAIAADLSAADQGIISLAFGEPCLPVIIASCYCFDFDN